MYKPHTPSVFPSVPQAVPLNLSSRGNPCVEITFLLHFRLLTFCSSICYKNYYIGFPMICQRPKITFFLHLSEISSKYRKRITFSHTLT